MMILCFILFCTLISIISLENNLRILQPQFKSSFPDQILNPVQEFSIKIPKDIISSTNPSSLTFTASLQNGQNLPDWIDFDETNVQFNGISPPTGSVTIKLIAQDSTGSTSLSFNITVLKSPPIVYVNNYYVFMVNTPIYIRINIISPDGSPFTYNVTLIGGMPLPSWLSYSYTTKAFTGQSNSSQTLIVQIRALNQNAVSLTNFTIQISPTLSSDYQLPVIDIYLSGNAEKWRIPENLFSVPSSYMNFTVSTVENKQLPSWISFSDNNKSFYITPHRNNKNPLQILLSARDPLHQNATFKLTFSTKNVNVTETVIQPEFNVNEFRPSSQSMRGAYLLPSGYILVLWESYLQDGSEYGIFAKFMDQNGKTQSEIRINTETTSNQAYPIFLNLKNGNILLAWQSLATDGSNYGIYAKEYDSSMNMVRDEFRVNNFTFEEQSAVNAIQFPNENIFYVWQSYSQDGSKYGVYGIIHDKSGNPITQEMRINNRTFDTQKSPTIYLIAEDLALVLWLSRSQDGEDYGIYARIYDSQGKSVIDEFKVNNYWKGAQLDPRVNLLPNGYILFVWQSDTADLSSFGIYAKIIDINNLVIVPEFRVNDYTPGQQINAKVAILNNTYIFVAWQSQYPPNNTYCIVGKILDLFGNTIRHEFVISEYPYADQQFVNMAVVSDKFIWIAWESYGQDGSGLGLYGKILDLNGNTVKRSFQVNSYSKGWQFDVRCLAMKNSKIFFAWSTETDGYGFDIFGKLSKYDLNILPDILIEFPDHSVIYNETFQYTIKKQDVMEYENQPLTFSAIQNNGTELPKWLSFSPTNRSFYGIPRIEDKGNYSISVVATDSKGGFDNVTFIIYVSGTRIKLDQKKNLLNPWEENGEEAAAVGETEATVEEQKHTKGEKNETDGFAFSLDWFVLLPFIIAAAIFCLICCWAFWKNKKIARRSRRVHAQRSPEESLQETELSERECLKDFVLVPENFICPITKGIMSNPWIVISEDQLIINSYERDVLEDWFREHDTDPLSKKKKRWAGENFPLRKDIENAMLKYTPDVLRENLELRALVGDWIRRKGEEDLLGDPELCDIVKNYKKSFEYKTKKTKKHR